MAVLAMLLSGGVLVFCAVIFAQRLARGSEPRRRFDPCGGGDAGWTPAAAGGDAGPDCGGADAGGGCDGGGGGD